MQNERENDKFIILYIQLYIKIKIKPHSSWAGLVL